ncbi:MAG: ABC transporter ATP-binding protein [Bacteroidales bacterium]|nr:ABC transporter ATP-binding protein [Candidatus Cryptobacteroides aphodequi]
MRLFKSSVRGILRFSKGGRAGIALYALLTLLQVACSLAFVACSRNVVDTATGAREGALTPAILAMALVLALQVASRVLSSYTQGRISISAKNRIRTAMFSHAMRSTWSGQKKFHSADIVNRLEEDIRVICEFLCSVLPSVLAVVCQFVAACIFLFRLSPSLAWVLVFIMPVAVVGSRLFFRKQRELSTRIRTIDGRIQGHMQEHLQFRSVDLAMGSEDMAEGALGDLQNDELDITRKRLRYSAISRAFMQLGFSSGYLLAFLWGVFGLRDGTITYGVMVAFLQLVGQVQRPVAQIANCIPAFIQAIASEERLAEVLSLDTESDEPDRPLEGAPGIRLENVGFSYEDGTAPVLSALNFDFKPGSFTSITGPTGVGKSTLIRLLLAFVKPSEGSISLYSGDTVLPCGKSARCNYMYVPQGNTLLSGTIRQNLLLADPDADDAQMRECLETAEAGFVFDLPDGLDSSLSEIGGGLSEGQAQRIAIARALLHKGGILILDEATSALDAETELKVLENIHRTCAGSKTIVCITHRPAALELSDAELSLIATA